MRTTLTLDDDVAAKLKRLRKKRGDSRFLALVNDALRRGLDAPEPARAPFETRPRDLGPASSAVSTTSKKSSRGSTASGTGDPRRRQSSFVCGQYRGARTSARAAGSTSGGTARLSSAPPPQLALFPVSVTLDNDDVFGGDDVWGTVTLSRAVQQTDAATDVQIVGKPDLWLNVFTRVAVGQSAARFKLQTQRVSHEISTHVEAKMAGSLGVITGLRLIPRPSLSSISPDSALQNSQVDVTLTGQYLALGGGTTVAASGTGMSISNVQVVNEQTVTARFNIAPDAQLFARSVIVTTNHGPTNPVTFTVFPGELVAAPAPVLTAITPPQGNDILVTLTGDNFTLGAPAAIAVSGEGVAVSGIDVRNDETIVATFTISIDALVGARSVTVRTANGTSQAVTFTVEEG